MLARRRTRHSSFHDRLVEHMSNKRVESTADGTIVLYQEKQPRKAEKTVALRLGEHVVIDASHIDNYCFSSKGELIDDIAAVLSGVRTADRAFIRHHGKAWGRRLALELPVFKLNLWKSHEVQNCLVDVLQYLTGDQWKFSFQQRTKKVESFRQEHVVAMPSRERVFMPYSSGLDSYAQAREIEKDGSGRELVMINVQPSRRLPKWDRLGHPSRGDVKSVPVAACFHEPHHTEPSFRTRPFVYDLLAAYGATMAEPARVVIPENGQGSLGGSLAPLGAEAPHRSCHPGFTVRLRSLVEALTGTRVEFAHPALFLTKGQVLKKLSENNPETSVWLGKHRSCSYDARHSSVGKFRMHCGVCGNCILRRVSLFWAGIEDSTSYRASNISSKTFDNMFSNTMPKEIKAYKDVAMNGIRAMQRMADLATQPESPRISAEVAGLARYLQRPNQDVRSRMHTFLEQHRLEWNAFLSSCGKESWVACLVRA